MKVIANNEKEARRKALELFGVSIFRDMIKNKSSEVVVEYGYEQLIDVEDEVFPDVCFVSTGSVVITKDDIERVIITKLEELQDLLNQFRSFKL